ncbi:alkaline phosphatase D [Tenacibaculum adriaticum]|uniref:Alkaline phosphatase D n=1 Tax=Tenacibaculum adriaticum TaxID=413713 RepID=A0A5S5DP25_9FLAO|nr:ectonucleotide pyrophosphatase/phosphodiesterase [Tenacibaculum adriaticum]TYP97475.1 alkaline phosphatase D [Tenacibaculum adriaticum]
MKYLFTFLLTIITSIIVAQENYVIILSLDGFSADYIEKYKTENIARIAKKGVRVKRMIPSNPTKTFPNHYTIATGLYPDNHGLIGNSFYAPKLNKEYSLSNRTSVENGDFYGGEPIWNTAKKAGLKIASYFWVGSEAKINGMQPDIWKKYNSNVTFEQRIDSVITWLKYPKEKRPNLVMLYYNQPDSAGHKYGPNSNEVAKQINYVDSQVGNLYKRLMELPFAKNINFILVSDHGMRSISKDKQIILEDYVPKTWMLGIYGNNPVYTIRAKKDNIDNIYKQLKKVKNLITYKRGEAPKKYNLANNSRTNDLIVIGKKGYSVFATHADGRYFGGTHGYLNCDKEMSAVFVASGNAFKQNYTQRTIKNIDVYNLIAHILGITPAKNDGDFNRVKKLLRN